MVLHSVDLDFAQRCLSGDESAVREFRNIRGPILEGILRQHRASSHQACDLVDSLCADCLVGQNGGRPLFERYNGIAPLNSWLITILMNRWISLRRHEDVHERNAQKIRASEGGGASGNALTEPGNEEFRTALLEAVRAGFLECEDEDMVMLRLVHQFGVTRSEIAKLWGWSISKVSRKLKVAENAIATTTRSKLKEFDSLLDVSLEDIITLCEGFEAP